MQRGGGHWLPGNVCLPDWTGESWNEIRRLLISQPPFGTLRVVLPLNTQAMLPQD